MTNDMPSRLLDRLLFGHRGVLAPVDVENRLRLSLEDFAIRA